MRKITFWILLTVFALTACLVFPAGAEEANSGTCGENVTWRFDASTTTLTISGTGPMDDLSDNNPWFSIGDSVKKIVVEEGVTTIGAEAFRSCFYLEQVQLPNTLTRIEERAFQSCQIRQITIPNSVTYLGNAAFEYCFYLNNVKLPESVVSCGYGLFSSCQSLTDITLPNSLTTLSDGMFSGCNSLQKITIPAGVTKLEDQVFNHCSALNSITFKGSAPTFAPDAFEKVTVTVYYPANNTTWTRDVRKNYGGTVTWAAEGANGTQASGTFGNSTQMSWKVDGTTLTITGDGYMDGFGFQDKAPWYPFRGVVKKVVFSGKIENIYAYALLDFTELTEVVWTPSIEYIFEGAFSGCTSLKTIAIPDTVENMGDGVFGNCTALHTVKLGKGLKELPYRAFGGCTALKTVTVPSSVKILWSEVFADSAVQTVYFQGNMPGFQKASYDQGPFAGMGKTTLYYAANNNTWTAAKIKEVEGWYSNGNVKFAATEELNQYTQNQQFVSDPKPTTGGTAGTGSTSGSTAPGGNEVPPETTAPTVGTHIPDSPSVGQTTTPTEETTAPTVPVDKDIPENDKPGGTWIVWLVVGVVVVADAVIGVIYLKKRKKGKKTED